MNKDAEATSSRILDNNSETQLAIETVSLDNPKLFINRELSWLCMHERILEEANDKNNPLLERVKFLAICGSNLDEFFMVRVSGLRRQLKKGALKLPPDGMTPFEQLTAIRKEVLILLENHTLCWRDRLIPELKDAGLEILRISDLEAKKQTALRQYFEHNVFPTLTPLAMDPTHPFPFISNLSINLAVILRDSEKHEKYARVKIPTKLFHRFILIPSETEAKTEQSKRQEFVFFEDLIAANLDMLFPGMEIVGVYPFRITRDAEIDIVLDQAGDLLTAIEESIETRRVGSPVRLEVSPDMPEYLRNLFVKNLGLTEDMVYPFDGPLAFIDFWELLNIVDRPDMKDTPFLPFTPMQLSEKTDIFAAVSQKDFVLYHPYDSFNVLVNLLHQAAHDPDVLSIMLTMYRIDKNSPVIESLKQARQNGKAVTALIELKAKFDEQNNIQWAKELEQEGVHVIYGLVHLKVHAKLCLVVRREKEGIVRYSHLSSGNYNAVTGRIYGDIGYLTANKTIGEDVSHLFNALTGYSEKAEYKMLLVAPARLRQEIIDRIDREIECFKKTGQGYIAWKLNGLLDKEVIQALYRASMAGIKIDLNVRGLCSLRPGIKGISENITVTSIVGRFLEHARIYYFWDKGNEEVLLGSSDMMPRNLDRRVEVLFPVPDQKVKKAIIEIMLKIHLKDMMKARRLLPDGTYEKIMPNDEEKSLNSQLWLINNRGIWHGIEK
ncbi:MAG: polyphosphate kinase 1 [Euryarchaeota archaeon]|nr:polyphosphate kinase 1 [Euryarchaeota archaeon]